jgi:predicted  nucleic acid-binding Zn-ribbon protein
LKEATAKRLQEQPEEGGMTKDRLRQYIDLKKEIQAQMERLETMRTQLMYPGQSIGDGMSRSNFAADRTAGKIASMIDLENALKESIKKAQKETIAIEKAIQSLDSAIDRELMRRKYLDGLTWEEVAEALCRSRQWVTVLHGRILLKLKEK